MTFRIKLFMLLKYVSRNPSRYSVLRSSYSCAKRASRETQCALKLNPVELGLKQDTDD